jgi:hypothetical protein
MKKIYIILAIILTTRFGICESRTLFTQLDWELLSSSRPMEEVVESYMQTHNLTDIEMTRLLLDNFHTNFAMSQTAGDSRLAAAGESLKALAILNNSAALHSLEDFSTDKWPVRVRVSAISCILNKVRTKDFSTASNVLTQTWRTADEHSFVRLVYLNQAKSASLAQRKEYIDFFKWAILRMEGASALELDKNLLELDSSWRTNEIRILNANRILAMDPPPFATGLCNAIVADYEIAAGLRQPDSKTRQQTSSEPTDADTGNVPVLDVQPNTAQTPVPVSCTGIAYVLGTIIVALFIVYLIWKSRSK